MIEKLKSIRAKTQVSIVIHFVGLVLIIYFVLNTVMLNSINILEERYVNEHIRRVESAIELKLTNLSQTASDWAAWTDSYEFMKNGNKKFIEDNITESALSNIKLNAMLFVNTKGENVFGCGMNLDKKEMVPVSQALIEYIKKSPIANNTNPNYRIKGLVLLPKGPMLIATWPILPSSGVGPVRGNLVIGRYLDNSEVSLLSRSLDVELAVERLDRLDPQRSKLYAAITKESPVLVRDLDNDKIEGYSILRDIEGQPVVGVSIKMDREITQIGRQGIKYVIYSLAIASFIFAAVMLLFLEKNILLRLLTLSREVRAIGNSSTFSMRLKSESKQDEIADVTEEINFMLDKLEESQIKIIESEALKKSNVELEKRVQERTSELSIMNESLQAEINERKRMEEELIKSKEKAEAANRSKSEFLANMSHEIRTPINGINGMIELTLLNELPLEQKDNLMIAQSCSQALLGIINDILDFSKMEAGKLAIDKLNFRCQDILDDVIKAHLQVALGKGLDLNYSLSASVPEMVAGDPNRLRQVLNNLLSNAIKFTDCGQVMLSVKSTGIAGDRPELTFSVTDTGIGISAEAMGKLFKPFSQLDGSNTRGYGGTGLGLAISKQLVEMMGGQIWVESEKGKGSTFAFTVSLAAATNALDISDAAALVKSYPAPKMLSVLLVEDDSVNRMVVQKYLHKLKHKVTCAADGQQAIELFTQQRYDVVLMDIQMPVMDGVEAMRRIREVETGRYTPVIALTAHALAGDRERYLAAGMDEYIAKPLQIGELQAKLERVTAFDITMLTSAEESAAGSAAEIEQAKIIEEISCLNQTIDRYTADLTLFESFVNRIKVLASQSGLEEIKTLAFKAELAARRGNMDDAVSYANRIRLIIETYRKTDI